MDLRHGRGQLSQYAARYPNARTTASFDETLADGDVEAVVIATPVPTHHALARQALEAGKHVFVEKPPAMRETRWRSSSRSRRSRTSC